VFGTALFAVIALLSGAPPASACEATAVHGPAVRAGPFRGYIVPRYDIVEGRFRLHVGPYRDREEGLSQKIPWFVPARYGPARRLTVTWRQLDGGGRFRLRLRGAPDAPGHRSRWVYPSSFSPRREGCWRLRFVSGKAQGRLTVLVAGRGR
jgi:hypothetical protein